MNPFLVMVLAKTKSTHIILQKINIRDHAVTVCRVMYISFIGCFVIVLTLNDLIVRAIVTGDFFVHYLRGVAILLWPCYKVLAYYTLSALLDWLCLTMFA